LKRYACKVNSCPNQAGHCYIVDETHLKIFGQHMKIWSMAINQEQCDIETASMNLAMTLMSSKSGTVNLLKEANNSFKKSSVMTTSVTSAASASVTSATQSASHHYYYNSLSSSDNQVSGHEPHRRQRQNSAMLRSFSVISESDSSIDRLNEYMNWLIRRYSEKIEELTMCKKMLRTHHIVFDTVLEVTEKLFDKWRIETGLQLLLKSQLKKYKHEVTKRRA
jgi:hypothetical protein